jgi:hypothetical protein
MNTVYRMWIILQLADFKYRKVVADKVDGTVQEMGGEVVKCGGLGDVCVVATFPHRKYRSVEKAVAVSLNTLPVKRTIVTAQDPYIMRPKTMALTMELYQRQDEVVGLAG